MANAETKKQLSPEQKKQIVDDYYSDILRRNTKTRIAQKYNITRNQLITIVKEYVTRENIKKEYIEKEKHEKLMRV